MKEKTKSGGKGSELRLYNKSQTHERKDSDEFEVGFMARLNEIVTKKPLSFR